MEYVVQPSALTHITQSNYFFDAISACEQMEASPANEFFGFGNDNGAFDPKRIDLRQLSSGSMQVISKCVENLDRALSDWEHRLSKEMNDAISKMFGANKNRIKLLNADMKRFQASIKDADKALKEPGLNERAISMIEQERQNAIDHFERTRAMIRDMSENILIPPDIYAAVNESLNLVNEGLNLIQTEFSSYEKTVDAKFKETDLRFGTIDEEKYIREMNMHRTTLSDPYSEIAKRLQEISSIATKINETRIFGQKAVIDPATAVHYELKNTRNITERYKKYREITAKIHKRLMVLRQDCKSLLAGKSAKNSPAMISQEIVFLTMFCLKYSDMMLLYMRPQLGIIEAASGAVK